MTGFVYQFIRVYQLKILSVGITFGGPAILRYKDQFKEAVFLAFDSTSWKDLKSFSSFIMAILLRILSETAGHFLKNLKSQLSQTRILAISALNTLLKKSPYKLSPGEKSAVLEDLQGNAKSSLEEALTHTFNG
ncbi:hypothetical protein Ahy_A05g022306 isoform I [Arachis hypogaea]|uniref:Uncharacterized protein n=1 Tax=Arachis hypogaea TaxID=3818 RepID=A0A445D0C8_ARAHY|nr:hypothetical protein Ahy_A05g022306 isoform I [Arachis hypogaea]